VILLEVGTVDPESHEVTFHGHYQGFNLDHYQRISRPREEKRGYHQYLDGHVYPLPRDQ
jgi:hypothetical protein